MVISTESNTTQPTELNNFVNDIGKPILPMLAIMLTRATVSGAWIVSNEWRINPEPNPFSPLAFRRDWARRFLQLTQNARGTATGQILSLSFTGGLVVANQINTNRNIADAQVLIAKLTQATGDELNNIKQQLRNKKDQGYLGAGGITFLLLLIDFISAHDTGNLGLNVLNMASTFAIVGAMIGTASNQLENALPSNLIN